MVDSKLNLINSITTADDESLSFLVTCLDDLELEVRWNAYHKLRSLRDEPSRNANLQGVIDRGIPLRVNDVVYSVYKSSIQYNDDNYDIDDYVQDSEYLLCGEVSSRYEEDFFTEGAAFRFIGDQNSWNPEQPVYAFLSLHIDEEAAILYAKERMKAYITGKDSLNSYYDNLGFESLDHKSDMRVSQHDIYSWVKPYHIANLPKPNAAPFVWIEEENWGEEYWENDEYWNYDRARYRYCDRVHQYAKDILELLDINLHYDAVEKIYLHTVGRFTCVRKEIVMKNIYMRPGKWLD
jgi:hypothetical protein